MTTPRWKAIPQVYGDLISFSGHRNRLEAGCNDITLWLGICTFFSGTHQLQVAEEKRCKSRSCFTAQQLKHSLYITTVNYNRGQIKKLLGTTCRPYIWHPCSKTCSFNYDEGKTYSFIVLKVATWGIVNASNSIHAGIAAPSSPALKPSLPAPIWRSLESWRRPHAYKPCRGPSNHFHFGGWKPEVTF